MYKAHFIGGYFDLSSQEICTRKPQEILKMVGTIEIGFGVGEHGGMPGCHSKTIHTLDYRLQSVTSRGVHIYELIDE
jgi:hypothetical protein